MSGILIDIEKPNSLQNQDEHFNFKSKLYDTFRSYIWIFPLVSALMLPIFCVILYTYAAYHGHLEPILQYVSDSGTFTPSAGYFAEALDIMAIFVFITSFARYKQVKYYLLVKVPKLLLTNEAKYQDLNPQLIPRLNKLNFTALLLAYLNLFSLISVGNFRCNEAFVLHAIGAMFMFNATFIYACCMISICELLSSKFAIESRPGTMRSGVILQLVALLGCIVFSAIAMLQFGYDRFFTEYKRLHWTSDQPGYWWHVLGTGCEWIMLNCNTVLFVCIFHRMKQFEEWQKVDL